MLKKKAILNETFKFENLYSGFLSYEDMKRIKGGNGDGNNGNENQTGDEWK